jgi:beta-fructofuranosidase
VLRLNDSWVWDFWLADDGRTYHMFFLKAPRSLGDPDLRHFNVTIGHATSADLIHWAEAADALAPAAPAFDDVAIWTGSVLRGLDGTWFMFYTGCTRTELGVKQRIGLATSADLYTWQRHPASPLLESDGRWYEQASPGHDEAWRDPWVFPDPAGDGWHMLVTARASHGVTGRRGVIGYARSRDLVHWQVQPPLSRPGTGFWHLEVQQVEVVNGCPVLMFSCLPEQVSGPGPRGAIWCVPGDSVLGPFDFSRAVPVSGENLYSGRLIRDRAGQWVMLAFRNLDANGGFIGEISDPMPVSWTQPRPGQIMSNLSGSGPVRSLRFNALIASTSSPGSSKSKMSMFSLMRSGVTELGKTMSPRSICQRSTTWAGVLPTRRAIASIVGSSRQLPCPSGDQASIEIWCPAQNSRTSSWVR